MTDEEINNKVMGFQQIIIDSQSKDIQEISRDYVKLQEKYTKLRDVWEKVKEEIKQSHEMIDNPDIKTGYEITLIIIDKHLKEVENE